MNLAQRSTVSHGKTRATFSLQRGPPRPPPQRPLAVSILSYDPFGDPSTPSATPSATRKPGGQWPYRAANDVWLRTPKAITHSDLVDAVASIFAPLRERDEHWRDEFKAVAAADVWFWSGVICGAAVDADHRLWRLTVDLTNSSSNGWGDQRLHTKLIRHAPLQAATTPRAESMAHPILRIARVKYPVGSVEGGLVLRFLNQRCIAEGIESEEDCFADPLRLAQWVRDARRWAEDTIRDEPKLFAALKREVGKEAIRCNKLFFASELKCGVKADSIDVTIAFIAWARRQRGFEVSSYRAQAWEFLVHVVDAALWLGWLFPKKRGGAPKVARR